MAIVQANGFWDDSGDAQASVPLAFASPVTAGNTLIAACRFQEDITPTVSDTLGNTWELIEREWNASEGFGVISYRAIASSSGANTVTFAFSTNNAQTRVGILEASGRHGVTPVNAFNSNVTFFNDDSTDAATSGTFTPTVDGCDIVGIFFANGAITISAGTDFTMHHGSIPTRTWIESRNQATAAETAATYTLEAASTTLAAVVGLALRPAETDIPGNASGGVATATASAPAGSASTARSVTVALRNGAGVLLNTVARRFWTRTTLDAAASDGGAGGLSVTCNGVGVFTLTGLTVLAGPGWLTYKDPSDDLNCHTVPVTFV